jgi:4'-phosphopantetheinyl transferase
MTDIFFLNIDNSLNKYDFDKLLNYISDEKKARIHRFHMFEDAQRSLLGDVLARYAICKLTAVRNQDFVFRTNEFGKPILVNPYGLHFNISHSGNWVVCAVDNNPVGIDVEIIKPIDFEIAERFFSKEEYFSLIKQPENMKLKYFYRIWTLKESYIKAEGKGLNIPLNSFNIRITDNSIYSLVGSEISKYCFYQSLLDDKTVYGLCTSSSNIDHRYNWSTNHFLQELFSNNSFL